MNLDTSLALADFLNPSDTSPVVDVRTAEEFAAGHIPGALNLPLFDRQERAAIGLCYKQHGPQMAIKLGLEYCGPRLRTMVEWAEKRAGSGRLRVHCWRGGMRSASVAWLWGFYGLKTVTLRGGYKSFRRFALEQFENPGPLRVLGGATGSGKTELLKEWQRSGVAALDLEELAGHKGSVFGNLGLPGQPTQEQFENNLGMALSRLPKDKPIWVEDESRHIGRLVLPKDFWDHLQKAPLWVGERSAPERCARIADEYGQHPVSSLLPLVDRIEPRLGGQRAKEVRESILSGDMQGAARGMLAYYDKAYLYGVEQRQAKNKDNVEKITRLAWRDLRPDL